MNKLVAIFILCLVSFSDAQTIGNVVRDVQGASYAIFQCANNEILKYDTSLDPPRFKCAADATGSGGYATIQEEGSNLTQQTTLNFIGTSITCVNDAGNNRTNCTVSGGTNALLDGTNHTDTEACTPTEGDIIYAKDNAGTIEWACLDACANHETVVWIDNVPICTPVSDIAASPCSDIDYHDGTCLFDDFLSASSSTGSGNLDFIVGDTAFIARTNGSGSSIGVIGEADAMQRRNAPGRVALHTGGTASTAGACFGKSRASIVFGGAGTPAGQVTGAAALEFTFVTPNILSAATQRWLTTIGFSAFSISGSNCDDSATTRVLHFAWSDNVNSGKFEVRAATQGGGAATTADTGITVVASTTYKACIAINSDATSVDFYLSTTLSAIDCSDPDNIVGTPVATITTCADIPSCQSAADAVGIVAAIRKSVGAGQNGFVVIDYVLFKEKWDTAR